MEYSVLMAVYKGDNPDYLRKSMLSMLNQSMPAEELVIVKDGPITKELQEVIDSIHNDFPGIIVQVDLRKNIGLGLALNEGLKACTNDIVARMDADDISLRKRCEKQLKEFEKDPDLDIIGCFVDEFAGNEDNIICTRTVPEIHEEIYEYAKQRSPFNHPTVMYKKSRVLTLGGYKDLRKNQDFDLWVRMLVSGCKAKNIGESLLLFRFYENTFKRRKSWSNTKFLIRTRYNAYKIGFSSFIDFLKVVCGQLLVCIMPVSFQKWFYQNFLRR